MRSSAWAWLSVSDPSATPTSTSVVSSSRLPSSFENGRPCVRNPLACAGHRPLLAAELGEVRHEHAPPRCETGRRHGRLQDHFRDTQPGRSR